MIFSICLEKAKFLVVMVFLCFLQELDVGGGVFWWGVCGVRFLLFLSFPSLFLSSSFLFSFIFTFSGFYSFLLFIALDAKKTSDGGVLFACLHCFCLELLSGLL